MGGMCPDSADHVYCDDRTDCPFAGQVCCASDNLTNGSSTAACASASQCTSSLRNVQQLCDPQEPNTCTGSVGMNPCRLDNNATIAGYAYCH
jgi:hypothetical protein